MQEQLPRNGVKTHHYDGYVMGFTLWGINRVAPTHPYSFFVVYRVMQLKLRNLRLSKPLNNIAEVFCAHS